MRVIFSRKGFDSSAGGGPSPIVAGQPITLPIPARDRSVTCYGDLSRPLSGLVSDLSGGRFTASSLCHLDPDLRMESTVAQRQPGWRATLGQVGAAQSHLANQGVCEGDLFLFFGLFSPAQKNQEGRWRFVGPRQHMIFGWLQIGEIWHLGCDGSHVGSTNPWLYTHPHVRPGYAENNTLYLAKSRLELPGPSEDIPGWGWFNRGFRLTSPGAPRVSDWLVPPWLDIHQGGVGMTYHPRKRWAGQGQLRAAGRGQEFVAHVGDRADVFTWLRTCLFSPGLNKEMDERL
jgi:hypothetical protein